MKTIKYIVGAGIAGLALWGGRHLYRLNRAGKKIVVEVGGRVHKVSLEGILVVVSYNIKNPTSSRVEMSAPLIKLVHNNKVLASSSMATVEIPEPVRSKSGRIMIAPYKETGIINTNILLPYLSLLGAGANLIIQLKNRLDSDSDEKVKFEIVTTSTIFTPIGNYPYDEKEVITV